LKSGVSLTATHSRPLVRLIARCRGTFGGTGLRLLAVFGMVLPGTRVFATPPQIVLPSEENQSASTQPGSPDSAETRSGGFLDGLSRTSYLLGDLGGIRPRLSKFGISINITETSEGLGNITGGTREGFEYDGLTQMDLQLDTQRAFNLHGGTFNISALQISTSRSGSRAWTRNSWSPPTGCCL
jgi:hypothetical protein